MTILKRLKLFEEETLVDGKGLGLDGGDAIFDKGLKISVAREMGEVHLTTEFEKACGLELVNGCVKALFCGFNILLKLHCR